MWKQKRFQGIKKVPRNIEGAFFQIKMTPNQIRMTGYEEDAFLIFFFRFDSNSPIRIKSANLG